MAKNSVNDYDQTASNNTDVASINIAEGCAPSNINNAIRAVMAHVGAFAQGGVTATSVKAAALTAQTATHSFAGGTTASYTAIYRNGVALDPASYAPVGAGMPVGAVVPYGGTSAPTGWLLCYGQAISRSTYSALFSAIGTTFGVGDNSTTFNVPDLRGRVIAGQDDMGGVSADRLTGLTDGVNGDTLGAAGGLESTTLTIAQMPLHGHPFRLSTQSGASSDDNGGLLVNANTQSNKTAFTGTPSDTAGEQIGGTGGGGAHNNVQPTAILNYIIYAAV